MPRVRRRWVPFLGPGHSLSPAQVSAMTRWRCVRVLLFGTWLDECPRFPGVLEIIPPHAQVSQGTRCYELGFCPFDFPELSKTSLCCSLNTSNVLGNGDIASANGRLWYVKHNRLIWWNVWAVAGWGVDIHNLAIRSHSVSWNKSQLKQSRAKRWESHCSKFNSQRCSEQVLFWCSGWKLFGYGHT